MAQNFGQDSTQPSMLVMAQSVESGDVVATDSVGNELVRYSPNKSYQSALISLPVLTVGESYTVVLGDETQTIDLTEMLYGSDGMGGERPDGMGCKRPNGAEDSKGAPPQRPTSGQEPPLAK